MVVRQETGAPFTTAEAAALLGRDDAFVARHLASGALVVGDNGGITRESLLALLATVNPRLRAVIAIADDTEGTDERSATSARLRALGVVTTPAPSGQEGEDGHVP